MSDTAPPQTAADIAKAWKEYCQRLGEIGSTLIEKVGAGSAEAATETALHATRLLRTSLEWQLDNQDPRAPKLTWYDRSCAGVAPYGPNLDNTYLYARVEDSGSYRLTLEVDCIDEINISVHSGSPYDGNMKVFGDLNFADLDIAGGKGAISFSRARVPGAWFELPEGAQFIFIRFYYFDWARAKPPAIIFERTDILASQPVFVPPENFTKGLAQAAHWLEGALNFGHAFGTRFLAGLQDNTCGPMREVSGGSSKIRYGGLRFDLAPDEALVIAFEKPEARYWSVQWQKLPWADPHDYMRRVISLNHTQAHVDDDNIVRVVVAHQDPGVQNWLDTGGRRNGFLMCRWIWFSSCPQPAAALVKLSELRAKLPAETPSFTPAQRAAQIESRRQHLSRRF